MILARRMDQSIIIGDDIIVTVTRIAGDTVKLGITAPRDVRVDRCEVRDAIERSKERGGER